MSFITKALGLNPQPPVEKFGTHLRKDNKFFTVPAARVLEKVSNLFAPSDPSTPPLSRPHFQFTINLERIRKTVERVTLLQNLQHWGVDTVIKGNNNLKPLIEKICPGLFETSPLKQPELVQQALDYQANRLDMLLHQVIRWAFLQPDWRNLSQDKVFDILSQVEGALTSKIKWIQDPYIPFLKIVIDERVKWHLRSFKEVTANSLSEFFNTLNEEIPLIYKKIPDMYHNNFLGADHPKVQENLRNQNDRVSITPEDIKARIIELEIKAAAEFLAPATEDQVPCCQLLNKLFVIPSQDHLSGPERTFLDQVISRWSLVASGQIKMISLEDFTKKPPANTNLNLQINKDLAEYAVLSTNIHELKFNSQAHELKTFKATLLILDAHKRKRVELEQTITRLFSEKVEIEEKLSKYPKKLDSTTVDLQIRLWDLQSKVTPAVGIRKYFLEKNLQQTQASFTQKITLLTNQSVDRATLNRLTLDISTTQAQLSVEDEALQKVQGELDKVRLQFKEIFKTSLQRYKTEQHTLLKKVYYLSNDEIEQLSLVDLP